jgi:hypothetical protein
MADNDKKENNLTTIISTIIVAIVTASTAPWWIQMLINGEITPPPSSSPSPEPLPTKIPPEPPPTKTPQVKFGNVSNYFTINKESINKSEIQFVVKAKEDFHGFMYANIYNQDGVQVCPIDCNIIKEFTIRFETDNRGLSRSWQQGETDRAYLRLPNNAQTIEVFFEN